MKFKMPETLEGLTLDEISELYAAAYAEAQELNKIADDKITPDESAELIELVGHLGSISDVKDQLEAAATADADALAAARAALEAPADEGGEDPDGDKGGDDPDPDADPHVDADQPKELVEASASKTPAAPAKSRKYGSFGVKVGSKEPADEPTGGQEPDPKDKGLRIEASANVPGFNSGAELDFDQLAVAYAKRARQFAGGGNSRLKGAKGIGDAKYGGDKLTDKAQRYGVATLVKPENEFTITEKMSAEDQYDLVKRAANERRLGGNGLIAAGGWCAPSERIYGFLEIETADGLLDLPEINSPRGGIQFTKGPDLGTLLVNANLGFTQTEAQAEAGTVKPIFDITCPAWTDVRMDAVGYAIRAGLLTDAAYPELLRRYLSLGLIVHARRLNALAIGRISTMIGAATVFAPVSGTRYSAISDFLSAVELNAMRVRETYAMGMNATVEGVFPLWALGVLRSDISRRTGISEFNVTDQQITAWLAARKVRAQFVRDYQAINSGAATTAGGTAAWTRWPDKVEFMLYPAGAYVRLATDVIDLDTVYDWDNLSKNQFLAAFFEEGFGIANTGAAGVKVQVAIDNVQGQSGFQGIGAVFA